MNAQKALEIITNAIQTDNMTAEQDMALAIAQKALEKQIYEKGYEDGKAKKVYGVWIEDDYGYFRCSECGYEYDSPEYITPYCPHCGANMDEEE